MPSSRARPLALAVWALCTLALASHALGAQAGTQRRDSAGARGGRATGVLPGHGVTNDPELAGAINEILSDTNAHMRMAPTRRATAEDSARAAAIVTLARASLTKYKDVKRAEADGYIRFLPNVEPQSIYHYTNYEYAVAALWVQDPGKPTSLLYKKDARGRMVLVGVMYTAHPEATTRELDERLPLGMAHWHEHVNFCGPERGAAPSQRTATALARWLRITTREACDAAGGRFVPRLFGWMAHAYVFAGDDPRTIWGGEGKGHMHGK